MKINVEADAQKQNNVWKNYKGIAQKFVAGHEEAKPGLKEELADQDEDDDVRPRNRFLDITLLALDIKIEPHSQGQV